MTPIIRQAQITDANGIAHVHIESWRTTYRGIVPDTFLASMSYEARERYWTGVLSQAESQDFVFVAQAEQGDIIGFTSGGPERSGDPVYKGELYAIYLLQEYQGQGIGRRLVASLAERLYQAGMSSMLLWVLAANPACRFYEALGGLPLKTHQITIGGAMLDEIAYGWLDIGRLRTLE